MIREFERDMEGLHKEGKLSDFEYNQLVCLNYIMGNLANIDVQLRDISDNLRNINIVRYYCNK